MASQSVAPAVDLSALVRAVRNVRDVVDRYAPGFPLHAKIMELQVAGGRGVDFDFTDRLAELFKLAASAEVTP